MLSPHDKSPLVFVAEDDAHIRELVVTRLAIAGYRTAHATDGAAAVRGIFESRPSAIILDINMPNMSGFEVLKRIKSDTWVCNTPVLMLTARDSQDDVRAALQLGAKDYLAKPFDEQKLLARVARLLRPVRVETKPVAQPAAQGATLGRPKPLPLNVELDDIDIDGI